MGKKGDMAENLHKIFLGYWVKASKNRIRARHFEEKNFHTFKFKF